METSRDSIAIAFVRQALDALTARGGDAQACARRTGIAPALLRSDGARVTAESYGRLWLDIATTLDDEFFGLDLRRMKAGSYAMLCRQSLHSDTLEPALHHIAAFFNLIFDETAVRLLTAGRNAVIELNDTPRSRPGDARNRVFAHETLLVLIHGLMCWLIGRRIVVRGATFSYPAPPWSAEYVDIFASNLRFRARRTSLIFGASILSAPIVQTPDSAQHFLRGAPANFILKYRNDRSLSARIRKRLRDTSPQDWPDLAALATELGMAPSTLHRRLRREGGRFGEIRDILRRDLAIGLLTASTNGVGEIAATLGFAEPSAFHRAFRKWTGVRPGDYRGGKESRNGHSPTRHRVP